MMTYKPCASSERGSRGAAEPKAASRSSLVLALGEMYALR